MAEGPGLRRALGVWGSTSIVVGTIIGSGIFLVPSTMIQRVGSTEMVFLVWVVAGLLSLPMTWMTIRGATIEGELGHFCVLVGYRRTVRVCRPGVIRHSGIVRHTCDGIISATGGQRRQHRKQDKRP